MTKEFQAKKDEESIEELIEVHPIIGSKINDIEALKYLLKTVLQSVIASNPIVTINQIPLLLIVPSLSWSRLQVESLVKYAIESLEFTGVNVLDLSIAATFGLGNGTSSLVVNLGKESCQISPVIHCQNFKFAGKFLKVGSQLINQELSKLLPNLSEQQVEALKNSKIFEVVNDDESFYSMNDLQQNDDDEFDVAKLVTEQEGEITKKEEGAEEEENSQPNNQLEKNFFIDPATKEKISIGKERFQGTSKLIAILSENIYNVLSKISDLSKRQECYNNLVFTGSTFKIPGFKQALLKKLHEDYLIIAPSEGKPKDKKAVINSAIAAYQQADEVVETTEVKSSVSQVPTSIKLGKFPEYFPEWKKPKETGGSWEDVYFLGAQIYAKQTFGANSNSSGELFVDSENYEEKGPQAIWTSAI